MSPAPPKPSLEEKIAQLGFLQATITRMATNCFLIKGWSVTLTAGVFALAVKDADKRFLVVAYFPILAFWILDGYYFRQEKLFRKLFDATAAEAPEVARFSFDTRPFKSIVGSIATHLLAGSIAPLYATLAIVVGVAGAWLR